ncbi:intradiol ring-cleavage dioxygenase [Streptomyces sp. ME08-AFT2]|uniref:intradiol ring-cleavage dioxygenase n=1 Tax=Streptomyces sp. ME08-AFT2 TaxID=3028683 RepID=UPI0029B456CD|nr:intradiol ring-cleavage dioxygenase [Streptomyces sp. ME08-AFT2]MDX3309155.1 intradiol ring-cleavage dioxygenase [Streptomyces sp. ME08-AFT2]
MTGNHENDASHANDASNEDVTGSPSAEAGRQGPRHKRDLTRRKVVVAGAGAAVAVGAGGALAAGAFAGEKKSATKPSTGGAKATASAGSSEACYLLTSETTEGPYYIDADKIRRDITEDKEGIPLTLALKVIDSETCKPVANAAVDIWHCDALGLYSGYESLSSGGGGAPTGAPTGTPTDEPTAAPTGEPPSGGGGGGGGHEEPTDDKRYLRGTWKTDRQGRVTFKTVFPGWYRGRTVHIHTKVHVDGKWTDAGYEGGHACHTGQFFFDEASVIAASAVAPYSTSTTERTTLTEDTIYDQSGTQGGLLQLKYDKKRIARGVVGSITMAVEPDATHDGTDDGVQPGASASSE